MARGRTGLLLLSLLALAVAPAGALADSWSGTRAMTVQRQGHTATLLPGGQVLVAGGRLGTTVAPTTATSERWDPASALWHGSPSFDTGRHLHGGSLLPDGRVLIAGGQQTDYTVLASAQLFDPATNTWGPADDMPSGHAAHTQVTLQDGRVLVIGGYASRDDSNADRPSTQVELFDPATGRWAGAAAMPFLAARSTATLLDDGSVLVAGGTSSNVRRGIGYRYLPATDRWSAAGAFTDPRMNHVMARLPDGRVLIAGGTGDGGTYLRSASVYDPATNAWTDVAPMATARPEASATTLPNGKVLVAGGGASLDYFDTTELFDPATNTWSPGPPMATKRARHTATLLADGRVLVAGGSGQEPGAPVTGALYSAEIYTPDGWPFSRGGPGGPGGSGGGPGGGGPAGRPAISGLALSPTRFRAAASGPSATAAARRRRSVPVGTTVSWRNAAAATAIFTVLRPSAGRQAGGRCVRPSRANRRRARCTRWIAVGSFTHADAAGANRLRFTGRVGGRKLAPGRYRLSVAVRGGRAATPAIAHAAGFRIVG